MEGGLVARDSGSPPPGHCRGAHEQGTESPNCSQSATRGCPSVHSCMSMSLCVCVVVVFRVKCM